LLLLLLLLLFWVDAVANGKKYFGNLFAGCCEMILFDGSVLLSIFMSGSGSGVSLRERPRGGKIRRDHRFGEAFRGPHRVGRHQKRPRHQSRQIILIDSDGGDNQAAGTGEDQPCVSPNP
jgi:hypothetical protein